MAQPQNVYVGSTYDYSSTATVSGGSTFTWGVGTTNSAIVSDTASYGYNGTMNGSNFPITWKAAGTYYVLNKEVTTNSCSNSSYNFFQVIVNGVIPTYTISTANVTGVCSEVTGSTYPITLTFTSAPIYPITVSYKVNNVASIPIIITSATGPLTATLTLTAADNIAFNGTTSDVINTVQITNVTSHMATIAGTAPTSFTYKVWATPVVTGITPN